MRLQTLAGLERQQIERELKEKRALAASLEALLKDPKKVKGVIKDELGEIKDSYGDERKTKLVRSSPNEFSEADLIPDEETMIVLTRGGYIKRIKPENYRIQKRGGKGLIGMETKEEDVVEHLFTCNTHASLLFFTSAGKVYQVAAYEIPEGVRTAKGKAIFNFLSVAQNEQITSVLAVGKPKKASQVEKGYIVMVTKHGIMKKVVAGDFENVRRNGLIALTLKSGDRLDWVRLTTGGDHIILATRRGQVIRFKEAEIRAMGRQATGVKAIRLRKDDEVVGMDAVPNSKLKIQTSKLLVVMEHGYGKQTDVKQYKVQRRGGSGIKIAKVTPKTGVVVNTRIIGEEETELVVISRKGQVIRTDLQAIPNLNRATQGVRIMKMEEGDGIASVTTL